MMDVEKNDESLKEELENLYRDIMARENFISPTITLPKPKHPETKKVLLRYVAPFVALALLLTAASFFYPSAHLKLAIIMLVLVSYVGFIAADILELFALKGGVKKLMRNPLELMMEGLQDTVSEDTVIVEKLGHYSTKVLLFAKSRLQTQKESIESRLGLAVGAIKSTGVIPGLLVLGLAATDFGPGQLMLFLSVLMLTLYIGAYSAHFNLPRINLYTRLIDNEIQSRQ